MKIDNDTRAYILARLSVIRERMTAFAKKSSPARGLRKVLRMVSEIEEVIR